MSKELVISVHPDDETLGCGGTILKHIISNNEVHCLFVTSGNDNQKQIIKKVSELYGFKSNICLGLSELILADMSLSDIIPRISSVIQQIEPETLYIPNRSDIHSDHRAIYNAVAVCTKSFRYPYVKKILMSEVISETDFSPALLENAFLPNYFIDITETFSKKIEILQLYESELLPYPQTRNTNAMKALNRYRGSLINSEYAEAFMSLKIIER